MPVSTAAIELSQQGMVAEVKPKRLPKSKKGGKQVTELQATEDKMIVQSAQAGYSSEVFEAAGQAYLQGGQQKMAEVIGGGMGAMVVNMTRVVGKVRVEEDYDVWDKVVPSAESYDVWG